MPEIITKEHSQIVLRKFIEKRFAKIFMAIDSLRQNISIISNHYNMPTVESAAIFANVFLQFSFSGCFRIPSSKTVPLLPYKNRQPFITIEFVYLHHFRKQFSPAPSQNPRLLTINPQKTFTVSSGKPVVPRRSMRSIQLLHRV